MSLPAIVLGVIFTLIGYSLVTGSIWLVYSIILPTMPRLPDILAYVIAAPGAAAWVFGMTLATVVGFRLAASIVDGAALPKKWRNPLEWFGD